MVLARQVEVGLFDSDSKLRHLPFFEAVATSDEGSPDWQFTTAGLVVLRLVDAWLENAVVTADDDWGIRSVRAAVEGVDDGRPARAILIRVLDALEAQKPDIHVVVSPLMAFARALEYDAQWLMALDVYHTVLAHLHPTQDSDASIAAHIRLGHCYNNLNRLDDAATAFTAASEIANASGDIVGVLRARIGEAKLAIVRGNLPRAEQILDETIRRADGPAFQDVRWRALHERSNIAHQRGDYELAVQLAYAAFGQAQGASDRDRILSDLALAFSELGVYSAARDAYLVLSTTAQEQYTRWAAGINLLEVSSRTGAQMMFELFRRQLLGQPLPPFLATAYELNVGLGYKRFGDHDKAKHFFEKARALASEHGLNQYVFEAEEALSELEANTPPLMMSAPSVSLDVQEVAHAIRELREAVEVS
jgi:tetratricopeptide (TPR) repeat protein